MKNIMPIKKRFASVIIILSVIVLTGGCKKDKNNVDDSDIPSVDNAVFSGVYTFTITNFNDGWTSEVKEDWVEVSKGTMKVLLHYPKEGTVFPADPEPLIYAAWNILVAPRYSNIKNYIIAPTIPDWQRAYFASATLTELSTGTEVYVAFFRKGDSGWMEFVAPDKQTFIDFFGIDINTITWNSDYEIYDPLAVMAGYNKFAIAASDLPGKWSSDFASNTYYTNIYTGWSEGMSTYTSNITFEFGAKKYNWSLVAANSTGGYTDVAQAKSSGTYSVKDNWQIYCSDIEGKPSTYNAYFSCIKGARLLWMQNSEYGSYDVFGRIE